MGWLIWIATMFAHGQACVNCSMDPKYVQHEFH